MAKRTKSENADSSVPGTAASLPPARPKATIASTTALAEDRRALIASRVRFVLTRPSHPRNIGAAARAIKTMGFHRLVLVSPKSFPNPEADVVASRATDVLTQAPVVNSLTEALAGVAYAYAFAAQPRDLAHAALPVGRAMANVYELASGGAEIALVFGNETFGLSNEEVMLCNRLTFIPAASDYDSLNLAQAVQVAAFALAEATAALPQYPALAAQPAPREEVEGLVRAIEAAAVDSGFLDPAKPKRLVQRLQRLFARAEIEREEVAILRGIVASLSKARTARSG